MEINKEDKNFYRLNLSVVGAKPIILKGKFRKIWDNHVTFTTIRPFNNEGKRTKTICNHVNIHIKEVERQIDISKLVKGHKYYMIAYCREYNDSSGRWGITLASDIVECALFRTTERERITDDLLKICYQCKEEDFLECEE